MSSRIFLDTAPIIYFLDKKEPYFEKLLDFFFDNSQDNSQFYTSAITNTEFLTIPYRNKDEEKIESYNKFLNLLDFKIIDINSEISRIAAKIRAKYQYIKTIDSLQIASSIEYGCDLFFTNDKQLKQVTEVNVKLVDA